LTDTAQFITEIAEADPVAFCQDRVFALDSWLFDESNLDELTGDYVDFRAAISDTVGVSEGDVRLVGSARFGLSMSPSKGVRPFNDQSDLDVVIVSSDLFNEVWGEFRATYYNGYTWVKSRHSGDIFRRFLNLVRAGNYETDYLKKVARRLDGMARTVVLRTGLSRDLKYRIYEDWDAATEYHAYGVRKLQRIIQNGPQ